MSQGVNRTCRNVVLGMKMYDNDFEIKENKTWIKDKTDPPNIFTRWILIAQVTQLHCLTKHRQYLIKSISRR